MVLPPSSVQEPKGVGMRLSKIRGSLSYYSERELSDESGDVLCLAYGRAGDRVQEKMYHAISYLF